MITWDWRHWGLSYTKLPDTTILPVNRIFVFGPMAIGWNK